MSRKSASKSQKTLAQNVFAIGSSITQCDDEAYDLTAARNYPEALKRYFQILNIIEEHGLNKLRQMGIGNIDFIKSNAIANIGMCYECMKDAEKAKTYAQQAIELNSNDYASRLRLGKMLSILGEKQAAAKCFRYLVSPYKKIPDEIKQEAGHLLLQNDINDIAEGKEEKIKGPSKPLLKAPNPDEQALHHIERKQSNDELEAMLVRYKVLSESTNINTRLIALFNWGIIYTRENYRSRDISLAMKRFKECIDLFNANLPITEDDAYANSTMALAAFNLAAILDDPANAAWNSAEALKFYEIAAEGNIPNALHNLAYKYEHGEDVALDLDKAIAYYKAATKLGYAQSQHNLAVIYLHKRKNIGEAISALTLQNLTSAEDICMLGDCYFHKYNELESKEEKSEGNKAKKLKDEQTRCAKKAFAQFKKAAALGDIRAIFNCATFLEEGIGVAKDEKAAEEHYLKAGEKGMASAFATLATMYEDKVSSDKDAAKKAYTYDRKAADLGDVESLYNCGYRLHHGMGVQKDEKAAEECYRKAAEKGERQAFIGLTVIYREKLNVEKDIKRVDDYRKAIISFYKEGGLATNDQLQRLLEGEDFVNLLDAELTLIKRNLATKFFTLKQAIIEIENNHRLKLTKRIENILAKDIADFNTDNIALLIQRLGRLTKESLDNREFHKAQLPRVLLFIKEAKKRLIEDRFNVQQIVMVIEGLSKLQLKASVAEFSEAIEAFYNQVKLKLDSLNTVQLVNVVYAATRLDPAQPLFKEVLPLLIQAALRKIATADRQSLANLIYALVIFDKRMPGITNIQGFKDLIAQLNVTFGADNQGSTEEKSESKQGQTDEKATASSPEGMADKIQLRQVYLALFYFSKKYPDITGVFKDDLLKRWRSILSQENNEVTQSRLQTEVIQFLEQYIPAAESEKRINTLPVDALFMISQVLAFIAQIDGPPHFLHDEIGNPIPTLKTEFRNQILEMSSNYPTICFSYDELRQYSTQRFMYFSKKLKDEAGIDLNPAEVWKKVTARKEPAFSSFIFSSTANQPPAAMQQPVKVEENNNQLRM